MFLKLGIVQTTAVSKMDMFTDCQLHYDYKDDKFSVIWKGTVALL